MLSKRNEKRSGKPSTRNRRRSKDEQTRKKRVKCKTAVVEVETAAPSEPVAAPDASSAPSVSPAPSELGTISSLEDLRRLHAGGNFPDAPEVDEKTAQVMAFLRGKEEALRWEFRMEDPELEEIRVRLYKLNRRKRYLAHAQRMGYSWGRNATGASSEAVSSRESSADQQLASGVAGAEGGRAVRPYASKDELQQFMSMKEALNCGIPMKRHLLACNL